MLKNLNIILVMIFILITTITTYGSASEVNTNFTQNTVEEDISDQELQEIIHPYNATNFFITTMAQKLVFPSYIDLKSQMVSNDFSKPPSA